MATLILSETEARIIERLTREEILRLRNMSDVLTIYFPLRRRLVTSKAKAHHEVVHHRDGNPLNHDIANLMIMKQEDNND